MFQMRYDPVMGNGMGRYDIDLDQWIENYVTRRYGEYSEMRMKHRMILKILLIWFKGSCSFFC